MGKDAKGHGSNGKGVGHYSVRPPKVVEASGKTRKPMVAPVATQKPRVAPSVPKSKPMVIPAPSLSTKRPSVPTATVGRFARLRDKDRAIAARDKRR